MSVDMLVAGRIRMKVYIGLADLVIQVQSVVLRSDPELTGFVLSDLHDVVAADPTGLPGFSYAGEATGRRIEEIESTGMCAYPEPALAVAVNGFHQVRSDRLLFLYIETIVGELPGFAASVVEPAAIRSDPEPPVSIPKDAADDIIAQTLFTITGLNGLERRIPGIADVYPSVIGARPEISRPVQTDIVYGILRKAVPVAGYMSVNRKLVVFRRPNTESFLRSYPESAGSVRFEFSDIIMGKFQHRIIRTCYPVEISFFGIKAEETGICRTEP